MLHQVPVLTLRDGLRATQPSSGTNPRQPSSPSAKPTIAYNRNGPDVLIAGVRGLTVVKFAPPRGQAHVDAVDSPR